MVVELAVLEVLRKQAIQGNGEEHPLSKTKIRERLLEEYADVEDVHKVFTPAKIRTAIDRLIDHGDQTNKQIVYYQSTSRDDGSDYRTGFYVKNDFTDMELKFLIDSVMYSRVMDSASAEDLSKRLQSLSGKALKDVTLYTSEAVFGRRGPASGVNVLENMKTILKAIFEFRYLRFTKNIYEMENNRIVLLPEKQYCVIPLQVFMTNGQYYMLAEYGLKKKVYTFRLDLMTDLVITRKKVDTCHFEVDDVVRTRAEYLRQHPFVMGGEPQRFTLRVNRDVLSILVGTFGTEITVVPGTVTDKTVDVWVTASEQGMKQWLLLNYDSVSVIEATPKFMQAMKETSQLLREKYAKE